MSEQIQGGAGGGEGGAGGVPGGAAGGAGAPGAAGGGAPAAGAGGAAGPGVRPAALPVRPGAAGISGPALNERLARERAAGQKAAYAELGITDPETAKKGLARLAELEAKNEEANRAQMSEMDRLKADLEASRGREQTLQAQLDNVHQERSYEKQDTLILGIAARFVNPKATRLARVEFGHYVKTLTPKEQEQLTDRDVDKWFRAYAKENPEFALAAGDAAAAQAAAAKAPKPAQRVITNGLPARRATPPGGAQGRSGGAAPSLERGELPDGKTIRPGPKQADRATVREMFRKQGITYSG